MNNGHPSNTEEALIQAASRGDQNAFEALLKRYARPLTEYVRAHTRSAQDAEDIVQETFLRAFKHLGSCGPVYSLRGWLFTIAYRLIVSAARKRRPQCLSDEAAVSLAAPGGPARDGDWLWTQVRRMEPADSTILWLRYRQDMPVEEIAKVMKKSVSGVRVRLHRARGRLAKKLAACEDASDYIPGPARAAFCMERAK